MTLANPYLIEESQSKLLSNSFSQFLLNPPADEKKLIALEDSLIVGLF